MKEDYLWNKKGSDAGIEQLENALEQFRFKATESPAIPANVLVLPEKRSLGFFKLGLVFAVSLVIVGSIIWMRFATISNSTDHNVLADRGDSQKTGVSVQPIEPKHPVTEIPGAEKHFEKAVHPSRSPTKPIRTIVRRSEIKTQPEKLTQEEKYAYGQLMLALAITGNELKIVRDKINGREERNAADDREK